jgi:magnesium-transporting ATPase (P-type)
MAYQCSGCEAQTFINIILFAIGAVLVVMGHLGDAVVTARLVLLASLLGILLTISSLINHAPLVEAIQMAAVIVVLVPQGLFFMITLALCYGRGAHGRQGGSGAAGQCHRVPEQRAGAMPG